MANKRINYDPLIQQVLLNSTQPLDVQKIRRACNIGNWLTAMKHCLELLCEGKIQGTKTSKGWIFWTDCTEHHEHAIRLQSYKPQPEQSNVGTISLSNSPITDGVIRTRKSSTRGK
ncbi:MAG: hypothetical protein ABSF09_13515 [Candidatus Bathyarchaeia archaeon]